MSSVMSSTVSSRKPSLFKAASILISSNLGILEPNITLWRRLRSSHPYPSSCLNSTVSGLMSRTFLRNDIIGPEDFHGAVYYEELEKEDKSYEFIQAIEQWFPEHGKKTEERKKGTGLSEVLEIGAHFQISDINLIKPGIGETTRVLLRRVPWKILISEKWKGHQSLTHIYRLAGEKQVEIQLYPLKHYKACGIIKKYSDA